jgi:hypothetical protein
VRTKTTGARSSLGGGETVAASSAAVARVELRRMAMDEWKERRRGRAARGSGGDGLQRVGNWSRDTATPILMGGNGGQRREGVRCWAPCGG